MNRRGAIVIVTLVMAATVGLASAALAQLSAVAVGDPRPSNPISAPSSTATPSPSPTATPLPPSATPTVAEEPVWLYTVQEGDSISGLAARFGTTVEALLVLNPAYRGNEDLVEEGAPFVMPCTPLARAEGRCG